MVMLMHSNGRDIGKRKERRSLWKKWEKWKRTRKVRTKSKTKRLAEDLANGNNEFNVSTFDKNYT